jgi:hypothetical protein
MPNEGLYKSEDVALIWGEHIALAGRVRLSAVAWLGREVARL